MTRQITTEAELDALPIGTVILSRDYPNGPEPAETKASFQKRPDGNWYRGARASWVHPDGFLPATILHPLPLPDREKIAEVIARSLRQDIDPDAPARVYELHHLAADAVLELFR